MRSNRLSYSPGRTETLSALVPEPQPDLIRATSTKRLNRVEGAFGDLFLKYREPHSPDNVTDEIKNGRKQHRRSGRCHNQEQTNHPGGPKNFTAVKFEGFPTKLGEPTFDIGNSPRGIRYSPQHDSRRYHDPIGAQRA